MSEWPELPAVGELVRLPLPLPPTLLHAAGYRGGARYVALFWMPYGDELMLCDGAVTSTGWWPAWTTLAQHPLGRVILGPYELGSSETEAVHWLLADRHDATLEVGAERDVRQFLATQPSELSAAVGSSAPSACANCSSSSSTTRPHRRSRTCTANCASRARSSAT